MSNRNDLVEMASSPLSDEERQQLEEHERIIHEGQKTFRGVGKALRAIQIDRLYRETHETFEAYVADCFGISRGQAYNLMAAADADENLASFGEAAPINEYQVRPLTKLDAAKQKEAWERAVADAGGKRPTHDAVKAVVDEMEGKTPVVQFAPLPLRAADFEAAKVYRPGELRELIGDIEPGSVDLLMVSALRSEDLGDAAEEVRAYLRSAAQAMKSDHQVLVVCPCPDYRRLVEAVEAEGYEFGVPVVISMGAGQTLAPFSFLNEAQFVLHFRKGNAALCKQIGNVLAADEDASIPGGRPLELLDELIAAAIPAGATVLDPSAGSAATVAACCQNERNALGLETNLDIYERGLAFLKAA
jgi:hypothetical protein